MSDMIEKIALAIKEHSDCSDYVEDYFYAANAVLEALMQPTDEMADAMETEFRKPEYYEKSYITLWKGVFKAAIKEAMKEGK